MHELSVMDFLSKFDLSNLSEAPYNSNQFRRPLQRAAIS